MRRLNLAAKEMLTLTLANQTDCVFRRWPASFARVTAERRLSILCDDCGRILSIGGQG